MHDGDWTIYVDGDEVWYSCDYSFAGWDYTVVYDEAGDSEVVIWDD
jgi:hypothetical protein